MSLSSSLKQIYESSHYDILLGDQKITLSVQGVVSGKVDLLFHQPVAIITGYNPSAGCDSPRLQSVEDNEAANRDVELYLQRRGVEYYKAVGYAVTSAGHSDVQTEHQNLHQEPSFAVFRISKEEAAAIGRRFGQAAVFYFDGSRRSAGHIVPCGEDVYSLLQQLPLVELHIHAEGAIPADHLVSMSRSFADVTGKEPLFETEAGVRRYLKFKNFYEFIQKWISMLSLIQSADQYSEIVFQVMKSLHHIGVVHAELHFSPFDTIDLESQSYRLQPAAITEAAIDGLKRAKADFNMTGCLIADLVRNHPVETARNRIDMISPLIGDDLIGLGLGGSESKFAASLFTDAFDYARKKGFRTVAHAGETAGADSVRSALHDLKAERIGHGIRCLEDPSLVDELAGRQTPLEVCISSNDSLNVIDDISLHPVRKMIDVGLHVSLHSDDPTMFQTNIVNEYGWFVSDFGGTADEIRKLLSNACQASFLSKSQKQELQHKIM